MSQPTMKDRAIEWLQQTIDLEIEIEELYLRYGHPVSISDLRVLIKEYIAATNAAHFIMMDLAEIEPMVWDDEIGGGS